MVCVLELFSGTASFSKVARQMGYECFTVDSDPTCSPDLVADIVNLKVSDLPERFQHPDIVWASPPCTAFSVMQIGRNWRGGRWPKSAGAVLGVRLVEKTLSLIKDTRPMFVFIENPMGMMRKLPQLGGLRRVTITYCQYGFSYRKPTDIWTNSGRWYPRKACRNGDRCHVSARFGVQSLPTAAIRGRIPADLCREILLSCDSGFKSLEEWRGKFRKD